MRLLPLLLAVAAAGCSSRNDHFESGSRGWLDFRLTSGFGGETFGPGTAIAAGGTVTLEARGGSPWTLAVTSADKDVLKVLESSVDAASIDGDGLWRVPLEAKSLGTSRVELKLGWFRIGAVDLAVEPVGRFDWVVSGGTGVREGRVLVLRPGENAAISIRCLDVAGNPLAGVGAWELEEGGTILEGEPRRGVRTACHWETVGSLPGKPLLVTGVVPGTTELVITGLPPSPARLVIPLRVVPGSSPTPK
jgi:hypothetical protein